MGFLLYKLYFMKITEIYEKYNIIDNLQLHQLRTTAVAIRICNSLDVKVDKESIIKACLLHDMANIVKFDFTRFPEFYGRGGVEFWQKIKDEFISKYGIEEETATVKIAEEIGVNSYILMLIKSFAPSLSELNQLDDNFDKKICIYSDCRVCPFGVCSMEERIDEARRRYENSHLAFKEEDRILFNLNMKKIEDQIFSHSNIKKEDINDELIKEDLELLKNYSV